MPTYILSGSRTASCTFMGPLSTVSAPRLGAVTIAETVKRSGLSAQQIEEVYMGMVVQAGAGQAPARQAAIFAGLAENVNCVTVNKVCGSGMQSIIFGDTSIQQNESELVISGGMENMSMAPYLLPQVRGGNKFGETVMKDALQWDGLWDVYSQRGMGNCAEEAVRKYKISREEQDAYAIESFKRSQEAIKKGIFAKEIAPVTIENKKGNIIVAEDDGPMKADFQKIPKLNPSFEKSGTITAANASSINDGAASLLLGSEKYREQAQFKILAHSRFAHHPTWFTTAPVEAMKKCSEKAKISLNQIDLFEINEAFAIVPLIAMKELKLDHGRVNIYGGGIGLGHPIGCSGARIVVTLMSGLEQTHGRYGMASICIGGGEALAMLIERLS